MDIKTGYFSYLEKYKAMGYTPISIARFTPSWFKGLHISYLAPSRKLLFSYKNNQINEEQFKEEYYKMLNRLDLSKILTKFNVSDNVILLCYEKTGNFCHRHLLADYLNSNFDMNIKELEVLWRY